MGDHVAEDDIQQFVVGELEGWTEEWGGGGGGQANDKKFVSG